MATVIPQHLQERLGPEASRELAEVMSAAAAASRDQVLEVVAERLERRLAETKAELERRISETEGKLRERLAELRVDTIKWMFIFWATQMTALVGIISLLLRR